MSGATLKTIALAALLLASTSGLDADSPAITSPSRVHDAGYGRLPLAFEPNQGQARGDVKFLARAADYTVFLTASEAILALHDLAAPAVQITFAGANRSARVTAADPLGGRSNYLIGNDQRRWHTGIPQFAKVRYDALYRGIDLVLYGNQRQLEYDFIVSPRADPGAIALSIAGADSVGSEANGDLVIVTASRSIRMPQPVAYQEIDGRRRDVAVRYRVRGNLVTFEAGAYDVTATLVIDPLVLASSSYLGGPGSDEPNDLAVDDAGNAYITGFTTGDFPATAGGLLPGRGSADAFVTKIDPSGSSVVYSTVFGGGAFDNALAVAVDAAGAAYVAGGTTSADFPTAAAIRSTLLGAQDAFVAKLDPGGASFVYSTLVGGSRVDEATDIALGASGEVYIAGTTSSGDLPAQNGVRPSFGGGSFDAFAVKLDATGTQVIYCTYLGGRGDEYGPSIAVDAAGSAYIVGPTGSADFPIVKALQPLFQGGFLGDAFVTKLSPDGSAFVYSTYLGGAGQDNASDVAVDPSGNVYVAGTTGSFNFPLAGGIARPTSSGKTDAFVTAINATGSALVFSARLGGSGSDGALRVALDAEGNVWVAGFTSSLNFPVKLALQPTYAGGLNDGFVTKLNAQGSAIAFSSYFGGALHDSIAGLAVGPSGGLYMAGLTTSTDVPTRNAFQAQNAGGTDAFVARLAWVPDSILKADAGPDRVIETKDACTGPLVLDGTRSTASPGHPIVKYVWLSEPLGTATGPAPMFTLPSAGTYAFQLTVIDDLHHTASDSVEVSLVDTTPPQIGGAAASPAVLWPPNHKMVPVAIEVDVTDQCNGPVTCEIETVTSNEPLADGDWKLTGALSVALRAERLGDGSGRVYTIAMKCTDAAGNSTSSSVTVPVPHNR